MAPFAEDYVIVATGDDSCELNWHYAYEWAGSLSPITGPIFAPVFAANGGRAVKKLAALVETTTAFD